LATLISKLLNFLIFRNTYLDKNVVFTCATTNSQGYLVSGSTNGTLRLYSGVPGMQNEKTVFPKRSKTNFQLDECIQGIDVTSNARYILATGTSTIFIVDTIVGDNKKSAFSDRLGDMKPDPIQLTLKLEDVKKVGIVKFSVAKFNVDVNEEWIVTTTGNFVISWNFKRVLNGEFNYQMKDMKGTILDKQLIEKDSSSNDASVVVMTDSKIQATVFQK
jgi:hypothetical protein